MPSKPKNRGDSKKDGISVEACHAIMKGIGEMEAENMLEGMTLEEKIPLAFEGARRGSIEDICFVSSFLEKFPETHAKEAIAILCKIIDQLEIITPPQSPSARHITNIALLGLSRIHASSIAHNRHTYHGILERSWLSILCRMQSVYDEILSSSFPSSSNLPFDPISAMTITSVHSIISVFVDREEVLKQNAGAGDGLLELLFKIWLTPDALMFDNSLGPLSPRRRCLYILETILAIDSDSKGVRLEMTVKTVLHQTRWELDLATERYLQHLRDPAKACGKCPMLFSLSMAIIHRLGEEQCSNDTICKLNDNLLKGGLLPITLKFLSFLLEEIDKAPESRVFSEEARVRMIGLCIELCRNSVTTRNGPYWTSCLLDLGLLSVVARILSSGQLLDISRGYLWSMIALDIPRYFCHRFVISAALNAVKKLTHSGDIKILEADDKGDLWRTFTNLLLERTTLKMALDRVNPEPGRKCINCKKPDSEARIFKCASCMSAFYCSKECQTISWKSGGHRLKCSKLKEVIDMTGTGRPFDIFINIVALSEFRRHYPGIERRLAEMKKSGLQPKDLFITITLTVPPTIVLRPLQEETASAGGHLQDRSRPSRVNVARTYDCCPNKIRVESYWGGRSSTVHTTVYLPPYDQLYLRGNVYMNNSQMKDALLICRRPAVDEEEKIIAFVLDEVDKHMMDAREHFVPPILDDNKSSVTIYDYIEKKAASNQNILSWLKLGSKF
ncbi:hypothetical protein SCHPADRAFT_925306 [Schizopora paradoxa]|uniref:MYND-type domain-containing protein n=1 Tax=Schizopora paradoxa TaxID=27342 RepID=A0A0H2S281_9AGAM|nr:hypothetical protein SCHPADRAFT_925306 [Schizopora paradoxa]